MAQAEVNENVLDHRVLHDWSNVNETNGTMHLSKDMTFNDGHRLSITVYSILFVISSIGNSTVLYMLTKRRLRGPLRIDIMLMHLAIADLMVTFLLMPLEIAWAWTVQWRSTDLMCRLMLFFRVFGLYLSSFVMVCISLDRYYAILKPLKRSYNRGRIMLACAWLGSVICSIPQAILFHLEEHPHVKGYFQCVTFHSFASEAQELIYQISTMCLMYAFPLIAFIYCYGAIYVEIYRKSQRVMKDVVAERFRRSNDDVLSRAKKRTLKMTITIVIVFIICWTPYYIIAMWYSLDKSTVSQVNSLVRKSLFIFASTNSCMNPLVYGLYNIRGRLNNNNMSVNNRHTSLSHRLDSSNQLLQKTTLTNGHSNVVAAAVAASTKLAHVVRLKTNGAGDSPVVGPVVTTAAGSESGVINDDSIVTIKGQTLTGQEQGSNATQEQPPKTPKTTIICLKCTFSCDDPVDPANSDKS
ncbi:gonadotropin-releasing hormone receptor isoform X2 [Scaptodrosophila lebanonensis]|uniref:Gonadotropin-releasing hormone receptor isoform X2 n=1 Tax=Drosophila lebanonensis TaxID=7225 RepID=A0A6J2U0Z8_DROLE|nr:gonadotropin-releasing hormone receptor isoform X2 [Scaptodrosophila lebanonensis]XP_030381139.1 gonadotropin-releasing hormone receptor isoform X2 [Scaptodrosophila lebanonensis]